MGRLNKPESYLTHEQERQSRSATAYVTATWQQDRDRSIRHTLPDSLAITLTSYPPRFPTLALTIKSLLAQSVRADNIYLWIAERDLEQLPADVEALKPYGLVIKSCEDLRSYKKIIPALMQTSVGFLVTADDDIYYPTNWLSEFVTAYRPNENVVLCARAHRIVLGNDGIPLPYLDWQLDVQSNDAERLLFPTSGAGALYQRDIFHEDVLRTDLFTELCPTADDVWFYWMVALNGGLFRTVGPKRELIYWLDSQQVALFITNRTANDVQIAKMISRYGFPRSNI